MELKFKKGDIVKIRTGGQIAMVIEYKINYAGSVIKYFSPNVDVPDEVITDKILCEWEVKGKIVRQYVTEANLELVTPAAV